MEKKLENNIQILEFDVVIAGTGFAGLEATYGAFSVKDIKSIGLISLLNGPSGSSFLNFNKRVGIQVPSSDIEKENFINRALDIGYPGSVDKNLVKILMEDVDCRFNELKELGIDFLQDEKGNLKKFRGCFLPEQQSAIVISDLTKAFTKLFNRIKHGVTFIPSVCILKILIDTTSNKICGLLCFDFKEKKMLGIKTKALVMAIGGVAPLFPHNISWNHPFSGMGLALLKDAGIQLINQGFIQMLWLKTRDCEFFPLGKFKDKNLLIIDGDKRGHLPDEYLNLIEVRDTHCPIGYHLEDSHLDAFLLNIMDDTGVKLRNKNELFFIRPFAQAQNGGAKVDEHGMTSVNGIFGCGECASGMHGANRIGGAMILSCLVFGYRAGKYAALFSKENDFLSDSLFIKLINNFLEKINYTSDPLESKLFDISKWLLLGNMEELITVKNNILDVISKEPPYIIKLKLKSLLIVVDGRIKILKEISQ